MSTITTTIRWDENELNRVKKEAKKVGLPVALFVKSTVLKELKKEEAIYSPKLIKAIRKAEAEIARGEYDEFDSVEEFMEDMDKIINEHEKSKKGQNNKNESL